MASLDAAGVTPLLVRLNLFMGSDLAAALTPLLVGSGYAGEQQSQNSPVSGSPGAFSATYSAAGGLAQAAGFLVTGQTISHANLTDPTSAAGNGGNLTMGMWFLDPPPATIGRVMGVFRQAQLTRHYVLSLDTLGAAAWGAGLSTSGWMTTSGLSLLSSGPSLGTASAYSCMPGGPSGAACATGLFAGGDSSQPSDWPVGIFASIGSPAGVSTETMQYYGASAGVRSGGYVIGYGLSAAQVASLAAAWAAFLVNTTRVAAVPPGAPPVPPAAAYSVRYVVPGYAGPLLNVQNAGVGGGAAVDLYPPASGFGGLAVGSPSGQLVSFWSPPVPATPLAGSASQSSTADNNFAAYGANNANDGVTACDTPSGIGVAFTSRAAGSWWQLDLGQAFYVASVVIYGRADPAGSSQSNTLQAYVGSNQAGSLNQLCATNVVAARNASSSPGVALPCATIGRYVTVVQTSNYDLALCEVQVFGTPPTVVNTWCESAPALPSVLGPNCPSAPRFFVLASALSPPDPVAAGTTRAAAAPTP